MVVVSTPVMFTFTSSASVFDCPSGAYDSHAASMSSQERADSFIGDDWLRASTRDRELRWVCMLRLGDLLSMEER